MMERTFAALLVCSLSSACGDPPHAGPTEKPQLAESAASAETSANPSASADQDDLTPPAPRAPEQAHRAVGFRPTGELLRACSLRSPVCVHFAADLAGSATAALEAADETFATLDALKLPRPLADGALGGDSRLDLYLDGAREGAVAIGDIGGAVPNLDRTSAFIVAEPPRVGCAPALSIASAISGAMLLGQDAALGPGVLTMLGDRLGVLAAPCGVAQDLAVDTAQRAPDRTLVGTDEDPAPASFLFPECLEDRFGTDEPGKLTVALAAISGQRTPAGKELVDEPDVFDALRVTQRVRKTSIADTVLDFAVDRAFLGSRSDDAHMIDVARYGDFGRPRFEWSVTHASLPRRLAPARPVEPLGATYLFVDMTKSQLPTEVTFVADWEAPVAFRWAVLELDEAGMQTARTDVVAVLGETHVEKSFRDLHGAASLVIVGVNEGEARRDEPFDPDLVRETAHGYTVTLYP